ncbi:hypothetical protein JOM56_000939 [Amanita muscaria]
MHRRMHRKKPQKLKKRMVRLATSVTCLSVLTHGYPGLLVSNDLNDYDATTFSRSFYRHGGVLQTRDGGFSDELLYVTERSGIHQSGSHSQRDTVQGIEEVLTPTFHENLSFEDGPSHESLFAHLHENTWIPPDLGDLSNELNYITECSGIHQSGSHSQRSTVQGIGEAFAPTFHENLSYEDGPSHEGLVAHLHESTWIPRNLGDLPNELNYVTECSGIHQSGSHSQRSTVTVGIEAVLAPTLHERVSYKDGRIQEFHAHSDLPPPPYINEDGGFEHPQEGETSAPLFERAGNERMASAAAAPKRRYAQGTLRCPLYVNGCNATFTTRHNLQYHLNSHYGIMPYHCRKGCPYKASSPSTMKRHEKNCGHIQQR